MNTLSISQSAQETSPNGQADHENQLSPEHAKMLQDSAIAPDVARERGYITLCDLKDLIKLGFADYQARPGLLIPIYDVAGNLVTYQLRPDTPRTRNGKWIKYETPKGSRMALDVPSRVRPQLDDPAIDLWVTEGAKKVDAGVSAGLCIVGVQGVWGWRGRNPKGGKALLADFQSIALNGRHVYLVFDSDCMTKRQVYNALAELSDVLKNRGAIVHFIYLPDNGSKVGLDDYLAAGHTVDELRALASDTLRDINPDTIHPEQQTSETINNTDLGNARRLVKRHGDKLRYVPAWDQWLIYDGKRWAKDESGEINRLARDTVRSIYEEAAAAKDDEDRRILAKHALSSENKQRLDSMVALAKYEPGIPVHHSLLDADPWLLNVRNGTLDLHTGVLREHRPEDLITKYIDVDYLPDAQCPLWHAFLNKIMDKDNAVITFLQRAVGYSLTGITEEHILFFLYGTGRNGKSVFCGTLRYLLADYAQKAPAEMLMTKRSGGIPNDIARLPGARFVVATEIEQGRYLAESLVKDLTGGDTMSARFMHKEWFDFKPTHKLWIYGNHKPVIKGTDEGIWSRIGLIPFKIYIPKSERDTQLEQKLCATELPGILAWAVQGCLDWQKHGITLPDAVSGATAEYRAEMDVVGAFLAACCEYGGQFKVSVKDLYTSYVEWCKENGEQPSTQRELSAKLKARGFIQKRSTGGEWGWRGVRRVGVKTDEDPDPDPEPSPDPAPHSDVSDVSDPPIHNILPNPPIREKMCNTASLTSLTSLEEKKPYIYITDPAQLQAYLPTLLNATEIGVDTETSMLTPIPPVEVKKKKNKPKDKRKTGRAATHYTDPYLDRICLLQLMAEGLPSPVLIHTSSCALDKIPEVRALFSSPDGPTLVLHNAKFDLAMLTTAGFDIAYVRSDGTPRVFDTMIASQVFNNSRFAEGLKTLAKRYLDIDLHKEEQASDWTTPVLTEAQLAYAAADTAVLLPLKQHLQAKLEQSNLQDTMTVEMGFISSMVEVTLTGMPFDVDAWKARVAADEEEKARWLSEMHTLAGEEVNWESSPQVLKVLREQGVKVGSTGQVVLMPYKEHPLVKALLAYRKVSKRVSSFGLEWLQYVHPKTGRIHADYMQIGTVTGRLSCSSPALGTLPKDQRMRACIKAPEGQALIVIDYSQFQIRIAAQLSQDPKMLQVFRSGGDIHKYTMEEVGTDSRKLAKELNFGLLFGASAQTFQQTALKKDLVLSLEEAEQRRSQFFEVYAGLRQWQHKTGHLEDIEKQDRRKTTLRTLAGRRYLNVTEYTDRLNYPVQGLEADILKMGLCLRWEDRIGMEDVRLAGLNHDEVIFEAPIEKATAAAEYIKQHLEHAGKYWLPDVPVEVEVTICKDWSGAPITEEEHVHA